MPGPFTTTSEDRSARALRDAIAAIEQAEPLATAGEIRRLLDHYLSSTKPQPAPPEPSIDAILQIRGLVQGHPRATCAISHQGGLLVIDALTAMDNAIERAAAAGARA